MAAPELVGVVAAAIRSCGCDPEEIAGAVERFLDGDGHVVVFHDDGWYTEHTIACRLAGMEHCPIHAHVEREVSRIKGPIVPLGRYIATFDRASGVRLEAVA